MIITSKSVYAQPDPADGIRVLMDRYWPRGLTREKAELDFWAGKLAPSIELASRFKEDGDFEQFALDYREELSSAEYLADFLDTIRDVPVLTVLYAATNTEHNHATVLCDQLRAVTTEQAGLAR